MIDFDLVIKYFAGKADPEEAMHIEEWAASSEDTGTFFHSLHQSWLEAGSEGYHIPDVKKEWEAFRQQHNLSHTQSFQPPRRVWLGRIAAAAAIVAVAFIGFYTFNSKNQNEPTLIAIAKEKAAEVRLADGTLMIVDPEGELVYPEHFKKESREVTLVGSGSFQVAHKPEQPFIVHLGELHIRVVGTSFHIFRGPKDISVQVKTGKIAFYNKKDTLYVSAGETGKYIWKEKRFLLENPQPLTGTFHFNNTPLSEVFTTLNAHFKVQIKAVNPALNSCKLSAGFENQTLEDILRDIAETFNLHYKIDKPYINIDGAACK